MSTELAPIQDEKKETEENCKDDCDSNEESKDNQNKETKTVYRWPPLESDPSIFNSYFHKLGLSDNCGFIELYGLDDESIKAVPVKILAVILAYQRKGDRIKLPPTEADYFMSQTDELDNCCGLIAGLHAIFNNLATANLNQGSILEKLYQSLTLIKDPNERAKVVDNCLEMKEMHQEAAEEVSS